MCVWKFVLARLKKEEKKVVKVTQCLLKHHRYITLASKHNNV